MAISLYLAVDLSEAEVKRFLPVHDTPPLPGITRLVVSAMGDEDPEAEFCRERFAIRPRSAVSFNVEKGEFHPDAGFLGYHSAFGVVARLLADTSADLILRDGSDRILLYRAGGLLVLNRDSDLWLTPAARALNRSFAVLPISP